MTTGIADYWNEYAEAYDQEPDHGLAEPDTRQAWESLLAGWLPTRPGRVADLACGTGSLTLLVAELGHDVVGVDVAATMLARARAKAAPFGGQVGLLQADVCAPPLQPAGVDVVLARHILWTLPDPQRALARWMRLVRPGGRLLLVEGRWASVGDDAYARGRTMPWAGGVSAADLLDAIRPLAPRTHLLPLTDPSLWGKEITDERYLLVAERQEASRT